MIFPMNGTKTGYGNGMWQGQQGMGKPPGVPQGNGTGQWKPPQKQ